MYVKDRMNKNAVTVQENTSLSKALSVMREFNHRRLPVVDAMNRPVGIVDKSGIENISGASFMLSNTKISEVMQTGFYKINENALVEECALLMKENKAYFVPVVDNAGSIVGVITSYDLIKGLMKLLGVSGDGCRLIVKGTDINKLLAVLKDCEIQSVYTDNGNTIAKFFTNDIDTVKYALKNKVNNARENELQNMIEGFNAHNLSSTIQWFAPVATSIVSIGAYQYFHDVLKIEDIMTSLRIFNAIQHPIRMIPGLINNFNEVAISMKRIQKYLVQDEINPGNIITKDKYMDTNNLSVRIVNGSYSWGIPPTSLAEIKMQDLKSRGINFDKFKKPNKRINFKPNKKENLSQIELSTKIREDGGFEMDKSQKINDISLINTNSNPKDKLISKIDKIEGGLGLDFFDKKEKKKINPLEPILKNINCEIKKGEFVCVIGEVGCGKSSLLQAILNCMIPLSGNSKLYVNGSISYVSQIPWIRNATIKDNILFYQPYDEERYNNVINLSELRQDLEIFEAGDLTEIGEKGINLSGGQKARVSIARALYSDRDIYIFDDPISALDANVGMKVMKNCIIKHLSNKTRILVTHALQYVSFFLLISETFVYQSSDVLCHSNPFLGRFVGQCIVR